MKLASAPLRSPLSYHVVASAAAEIGASIPAGAGFVAFTTSGAGDVERRVPLAEVRRFLIVVELFRTIPRFFFEIVLVMFLLLLLSTNFSRWRHVAQITLRYQHCIPETLPQDLADYPEVRDDFPAGFQLT